MIPKQRDLLIQMWSIAGRPGFAMTALELERLFEAQRVDMKGEAALWYYAIWKQRARAWDQMAETTAKV